MSHVTFANQFGEFFSPLLLALRATGFFEAHVYIPSMTLVAIILFLRLRFVLNENGTFLVATRKQIWVFYLAAYFGLCFLITNSTAVALKTSILEELDYEAPVWFAWLLTPLHFYISSVALAYLILIWRNMSTVLDAGLSVYIQIGLIGGYVTSVYRLFNEPFELTDPTSGFSGIFNLIWFGFMNQDIGRRFMQASRANSTKIAIPAIADARS